MNLPILVQAISEKRKVIINYEGTERIVEPYLVGINTKGNESLRAYQVGGYSSSGRLPSWRMFLVNNIQSIELTNEHFEINSMYNPNDKNMITILHRV